MAGIAMKILQLNKSRKIVTQTIFDNGISGVSFHSDIERSFILYLLISSVWTQVQPSAARSTQLPLPA
jgi:hypothetical protein